MTSDKKQPITKDGGNPKSSHLSKEWCISKISQLSKEAEQIRRMDNEAMYSYYQAMIQSLNLLAPYEESCFSKDIFYTAFPSLWLFHTQLKQVLIKNGGVQIDGLKKRELDILLETLGKFLDSFDPTLYRSIHAEQTFLMVPGYGGVLYTIPSKLSLMYMAFIRAVIQVLGEPAGTENQEFIYECVLVPKVNSKPVTSVIDFTLNPEQRLIDVRLSQRCLFVPHLTCLILSHEMAHYVGESKRHRKNRLDYMCYMLGIAVGNAVYSFGETIPDEMAPLFKEINQEIYELSEIVHELLYNNISGNMKESEYYFDGVADMLRLEARKLLEDSSIEIKKSYTVLGKQASEVIARAGKNRAEMLFYLERIYRERQSNVRKLLNGEYIDSVVQDFRICFKETYADVLALAMLDVKGEGNIWNDYLEAFFLSEGMGLAVDADSSIFINRVAAVVNTMTNDNPYEKEWKQKWDELGRTDKLTDKMQKIIDNVNIYREKRSKSKEREQAEGGQACFPSWDGREIANTQVMWDIESRYLSECLETMYKELEIKSQIPSEFIYVEEIRKLYHMLKCRDLDRNNWMRSFDQIIRHYEEDINKIVEKDISLMKAQN